MEHQEFKSVFKYGPLYPRLTEVLESIRNNSESPAKFGLVIRELEQNPLFECYGFECDEAIKESIAFLEKELIVARQMVKGIPYIGIIPNDIPKCQKIWMQMYSQYFTGIYGMKL